VITNRVLAPIVMPRSGFAGLLAANRSVQSDADPRGPQTRTESWINKRSYSWAKELSQTRVPGPCDHLDSAEI